jgi:hypothetical protein
MPTFRLNKNSATIHVSGVEKIALYFMWVRGEMWNKKRIKELKPYRNELMRPKHSEDEKREERLRNFMHKHHVSFFWKRGADIDDIQFRFTKGFSLPLPPHAKARGIRGADL